MKQFKISIEKIDELAKRVNFNKIDYQENIAMLSYADEHRTIRLNIYLYRLTVVICIAEKQTVRRKVDYENLKTIFEYTSEVCKGLIEQSNNDRV